MVQALLTGRENRERDMKAVSGLNLQHKDKA